MTIRAYLTIDDTPSQQSTALIDFLYERSVAAILFVRGDSMDADSAAVRYAIEKGLVIGNHNYSHTRASQLSFEDCVAEIEKTDDLIERAYQACGVKRPAKYFRFPHMDRGCGGWVIDYDAVDDPSHKDKLVSLFADGLNVSLDKPSDADMEKKHALQNYLKLQGFTAPYQDTGFAWYDDTEVGQAIDAMFTYSTSDWMLNARHLARDWPYKSVEDINAKFDAEVLADPLAEQTTHVILAHDHAEISTKTLAIIQYMLDKDVEFLPLQ